MAELEAPNSEAREREEMRSAHQEAEAEAEAGAEVKSSDDFLSFTWLGLGVRVWQFGERKKKNQKGKPVKSTKKMRVR